MARGQRATRPPGRLGSWEAAVHALATGGVIAFPTDTVYALACSLRHEAAIGRVFAIKGRPLAKPLPVLLGAPARLPVVSSSDDPRVQRFVARYWPGPLTVVVPAVAGLPAGVIGPGETVGVRVPDHRLATELIERAGGAVIATSANLSGEPPACTAGEVEAQLGGEVDVVIDGGMTTGGVASTVVAFAGDDLRVVREGALPGDELCQMWREIVDGAG